MALTWWQRPISRRTMLGGSAALGVALWAGPRMQARASGAVPEPLKQPEARGVGGAVASVDPYASDIGLRVLNSGGNAMDAAIATAAALGVTEPFSCGIGGGGFLMYRKGDTGEVFALDGRETAPAAFAENQFQDDQGAALDFDSVVTSGLSVGVPGTLATWASALERFGTRDLASLLEPAAALAETGFVVDQNYHDHIASNAERFAKFPETARLFLPGGSVPSVGSRFVNADLARTYRDIAAAGIDSFYTGELAEAIVDAAASPKTAAGVDVYSSPMVAGDMAAYAVRWLEPTVSEHRGMTVYGMPAPSSGGIAVGQILNLLREYEARTGRILAELSEAEYLHWFAEASSTAFADRNRWVGDLDDVPTAELLSVGFAKERAALFDPERAQERPIPFGWPDGDYDSPNPDAARQPEPYEGDSTTHLNVIDRWGNTVSYTLTIEQTGGSGIVVPGRGFLLNNELTDFNFEPTTEGVPEPNLPGPGKRPRSSMAPTIITDDAGTRLSVGTPGGATIITSVAQIILGYFERGLPLVEAIAAPRLSSRNSMPERVDMGLHTSDVGAELTALGHELEEDGWIGNASGIAVVDGGVIAAAETERGGGGAARVQGVGGDDAPNDPPAPEEQPTPAPTPDGDSGGSRGLPKTGR